ncbi:MAG TPA: hypothetical protein VF789_22130 [Thermoanaerobaculia bacterium]
MLRFVVALLAEARPLVERFRMEVVEEAPFAVYRGREGWLILSGHGKAAAAAATAYLHLASGGVMSRAWINVGLGGHRQRPLGEGVVAHKISDAASGASWYPQLVIDSPRPTAPVLTVERMEEEYSLPWVYESEAAGFFPIACRFSTAELVHCYKIVSDNPDATLSRRMSAAAVEDLVASNLEEIMVFAGDLAGLARQLAGFLADPPGYQEILAKWDFPTPWRRRLRRLLQRLAVLDPEGPPALDGARDPAEILALLESRLAAIPIRLPVLAGGLSHDLR